MSVTAWTRLLIPLPRPQAGFGTAEQAAWSADGAQWSPPSLPPASFFAAFHSPWRGDTKGDSTFQDRFVCIRLKCVFDWTITFCADSDSSIGPRRGVGGVLRFSFTSCSIRPCQMRQLKQPGLFVLWLGLGCEILGQQQSVCISLQLENTSHMASALSSFSGDLKSSFLLTKASLGAMFSVLDSLFSIWTDQRHT